MWDMCLEVCVNKGIIKTGKLVWTPATPCLPVFLFYSDNKFYNICNPISSASFNKSSGQREH